MKYNVIENGHDSTNYIIATYEDDTGAGKSAFARRAKDKAERTAKEFTEKYAYLGYGYTVEAAA